jgi:hypothetical protein
VDLTFVVQFFDLLGPFVVRCAKVHDLSCIEMLWIYCGFTVQLVVQQIHNKLNKWRLSLRRKSAAEVSRGSV